MSTLRMVLSLGTINFLLRHRQPNRERAWGESACAQSDIALYPRIPHKIAPAVIAKTTRTRCTLP